MDTVAVIKELESSYRSNQPLRLEIDAISRAYSSLDLNNPLCLDIGIANPVGSLLLRRLPGYWNSAVASAHAMSNANAVLEDEPFQIGEDGELPFEESQFDVVVLSRSAITGIPKRDNFIIRECHRVLKASGILIVTATYRKRLDLASKISRKTPRWGTYNEHQIFELLKQGFDVLGLKTYCRFWTELTHRFLQPERAGGWGASVVFWLAHQMDFFLFFTRGYQIIAQGRRKSWRERQRLSIQYGISMEESILRKIK